MLRVIFRFRRSGMSWPLTEGDTVELWVANHMIGQLSGELVVELLAHHLRDAQLRAELDLSLIPPRKPLSPAIQARQLARAEERRKRREA